MIGEVKRFISNTTLITKTFNMVTTINNSDIVYSQHLSTFINIDLMIHLYNIQNNHNNYLSQQLVNVIN